MAPLRVPDTDQGTMESECSFCYFPKPDWLCPLPSCLEVPRHSGRAQSSPLWDMEWLRIFLADWSKAFAFS